MPSIVAIMNANEVVERELLALLESAETPWMSELRLFDESPDFVRFRGAELTIGPWRPDAFAGVDIAIGGGEREVSAGAVAVAVATPGSDPDDSPLVVPTLNPADIEEHRGTVWLADAATASIALLAQAIGGAAPLIRAAATVLSPASALGPAGIEELYGQVRALFGQQPLPDAVIGDRLAFNLLPGPLAVVTPALLPCPCTMRSVMVPVFGGTTIALDVWVNGELSVEDARGALAATRGVELWDSVQPALVIGAPEVRVQLPARGGAVLQLLAVCDEVRRTAGALRDAAREIVERDAF